MATGCGVPLRGQPTQVLNRGALASPQGRAWHATPRTSRRRARSRSRRSRRGARAGCGPVAGAPAGSTNAWRARRICRAQRTSAGSAKQRWMTRTTSGSSSRGPVRTSTSNAMTVARKTKKAARMIHACTATRPRRTKAIATSSVGSTSTCAARKRSTTKPARVPNISRGPPSPSARPRPRPAPRRPAPPPRPPPARASSSWPASAGRRAGSSPGRAGSRSRTSRAARPSR